MTLFNEYLQVDAEYITNMASPKCAVKDWIYLPTEVGSIPLYFK